MKSRTLENNQSYQASSISIFPVYINKRTLIENEPFDTKYILKIMRSLFPMKNDCAPHSDFDEIITELNAFGIKTRKQLRLFLKKHRRWLIMIEKEPLDKLHQKFYRELYGEKDYLDCVRRQYWFCYPALIRNALEKEFGDQYTTFATNRDNGTNVMLEKK